MWRLAILIWILAGTVLAGVAVATVLVDPDFLTEASRLIPVAGIGGYIIGIPVAFIVTGYIAKSGSMHV